MEALPEVDHDDSRPPYLQIAGFLRAQILTGELPAGARVPSQTELAKRFGVARGTVQEAMRVLKDEGIIASQRGGRTSVRARTERPIELRPHVETAFEHPQVAIDFAGYTSETLHGILQEPLDQVRSGRLAPESITIRLLLADMTRPIALPASEDGGDTPTARERVGAILTRHTNGLIDSVRELENFGLVKRARVEVRVHSCAPLFKMYLLNDSELFFGFYPVRKHTVQYKGDTLTFFDPMGKDAALFRFSDRDDNPIGSHFITQARTWFDSIWNSVARGYVHD